jgi:hypothetical protein
MANDKERLKNALDSMIYLPHLKDTQAHSVLAALLPDPNCPRGSGRPWDRGDLFRRLKTFRPATWFAKPDSISASECARRGWENTELDKLTCESCNAAVSCPISPHLLPNEAAKAGEQCKQRMTQAHDLSCPWRGTVCSKSLLRFPEMPRNVMLYDFKDRLEGMLQLVCVPPLSKDAIDMLFSGTLGPHVKRLAALGPQEILGSLRDDTTREASEDDLIQGTATFRQDKYLQRLRIIALCGWSLEVLSSNSTSEAKSTNINQCASTNCHGTIGPESSAFVCGLCGAKAGLWMFFPNCKPQASSKQGREGKFTVGLDVGRFASLRTSDRMSGCLMGALSRNIAIDLSTTIAGGSLSLGSRGDAKVVDANTSDNNSEQPVFGFQALHTKKRARNADFPNSEKKQRQDLGNHDKNVGRALSGMLDIQYETIVADPVDPLSLHRSYCPWVHSPPGSSGANSDDSVASATTESTGWQWAVRQLLAAAVPDRNVHLSGLTLTKDAGNGQEGSDDQSRGWDPSALLRNVLSKLEIKKL